MSRLRLSHAGVRRLRRATQGLAFAGFTLLVVYTLRDVHPPLPADTLVRLDPLAGLAAMLAGRAWLGRFLPAVVLLGATVALGRFWCGWLCPLGTLIEWTSPRAGRAKVAAGWRRLKYVLLFLILASALWGVLTLLILDPVTLFIRGVGTVALPALTWLVTALEGALYRFPALRGGLMAFDGAIRGTFLTYEQTYTAGIVGVAALLGAILLANRLAPRAWCRYGCPLGALLGLVAKAPGLKRRVGETCVSCGACARSCPMGTVDGAQGYASDSAECTLCLECAVRCPQDAITFGPEPRPERRWGYEPGRRHAIGALGLSVVGLGLVRADAAAHHPHPRLLRPPGVEDEEAFLAACVRCGQCLRACPTHGLQASLTEAGFAGVWTPILVPRLGACEYTCTACGEHCPTGAIPRLTVEEKHARPIGRAYVDEAICIPWSGRGDCIVCEEMCPLPEKAISLVERPVEDAMGERVLLAPVVDQERCIGCGLCEYRCPAQGEAAIRVRVDPFG
mgnify:CR=1 FL=1